MNIFDEMIRQVLDDRQSGSVAVLQQLIHGIIEYLSRDNEPDNHIKVIHDRLPIMIDKLGHFAVVGHFLQKLHSAMEKSHNKKDPAGQILQFVKKYDKAWENVNARVAGNAFKILDCSNKTILLHSNSSVVTSFFNKLKSEGVHVQVIQTESRPEYEGRKQAEKIAGLGFEVQFIVDAAAHFLMDRADLMLSGADQVHTNYFVNKIGTCAMALACREKQIRVHVLADSRKISRHTADPADLQNIHKPGDDIWRTQYKNIHPVNFYFEPIPTGLVSSFITESGQITPSRL